MNNSPDNHPVTVIPPAWAKAAAAVEAARDRGEEFLLTFIMTGLHLADLRDQLNAQGARNDLSGEALGWEKGCQEYLGFSRQTAERWILTAKSLRFLREIASGEATIIPASVIRGGTVPEILPRQAGREDLKVDATIRQQALDRLTACQAGDCSPHRVLGAFLGGIIGGAPTNGTGRRIPDPVEQLTLDFDGLDKHAEHIGAAWARWDPARKASAKTTLRKLLAGLPDDLKAEAARWLSEKGER